METNTVQNITDLLKGRIKLEGTSVNEFMEDMFATIRKGLERDRQVKIKGLGTFKLVDIDNRESVSINTGEHVMAERHVKVSFVPDTTMKELVNKPFSQFDTVVLNDGVVFNDETVDNNLAVNPVSTPDVEESVLTISQSHVASASVMSTEDEKRKDAPVPIEDTASSSVDESPSENELSKEATAPEKENKEEESNKGKLEDNTENSKFKKQRTSINEDDSLSENAIDKGINLQEEQEKTQEPIVKQEKPHIEETNVISVSAPRKNYLASILWHGIGCLIMISASAFAGFEYGLYHASQQGSLVKKETISKQLAKPMDACNTSQKELSTKTAIEEDSILQKAENPSLQSDKNQPKGDNVEGKIKDHKNTEQVVKSETVKSVTTGSQERYEADVRVRTGAYRIIGINSVVKAKTGETVKSISDRTLGPGMECYIEVVNGFLGNTKLVTGQTVKIPKLELKRRKAK